MYLLKYLLGVDVQVQVGKEEDNWIFAFWLGSLRRKDDIVIVIVSFVVVDKRMR